MSPPSLILTYTMLVLTAVVPALAKGDTCQLGSIHQCCKRGADDPQKRCAPGTAVACSKGSNSYCGHGCDRLPGYSDTLVYTPAPVDSGTNGGDQLWCLGCPTVSPFQCCRPANGITACQDQKKPTFLCEESGCGNQCDNPGFVRTHVQIPAPPSSNGQSYNDGEGHYWYCGA